MKDAKHTPGPWFAGDMESLCPKVSDEKGDICLVNYRISDDAAEPNARLIAAAPDLIAALDLALAAVVNPQCFDAETVEEALRTTIRKARGTK